MSEITITLCNPTTGQSESLPVSPTLSLSDLLEYSKAILGLDGNLILVKDGKPLGSPSLTLSQAHVCNGDLIVVIKKEAARAPAPIASGGLDFSNLLGTVPASTTNGDNPTYYPGMTLADALVSNPHPNAIVNLLKQHSHLFKELNYHNPMLAQKIKNQPYEKAVQIWREDRVKGSISSAAAITRSFHEEQEYSHRLRENPNDLGAKQYFQKKESKEEVQKQYQQAMEEYPESMGRVLMLYIEAKINNHAIQGFVDSGAQTTIMSKRCAEKCGVFHLVDTRFEGTAVGVGTGKILGRIHIVQLQIGDVYFPCSVTIMDDATLPSTAGKDEAKPKDMDFLLGLDMLKRHTCNIDLEQGKLKFRLAPGKYLETPFLHEKDLDGSKGGTKGFNADKANEELMNAQKKYEREGKDRMDEE
mmetsp:Transcript_868/g.1325  ORF Transcript_868/g.1325 Transcript_868/m.1325 type:complete len:416 (+) Transcript_868:68-1315(+)